MSDATTHPATRAVRDALDELEALCLSLGEGHEGCTTGYAVDLNNAVLADPYLFGTGYLPTREDAEALAALLIHHLNALGATAAAYDPDHWNTRAWTVPDQVAQDSWAYIVSAERDEHDEPVVEDIYHGDAWLVAGAAVPHTLGDDERARLGRVRKLIEGVGRHG